MKSSIYLSIQSRLGIIVIQTELENWSNIVYSPETHLKLKSAKAANLATNVNAIMGCISILNVDHS